MDDDDEFGELYDDVLLPLSSLSYLPSNPAVANLKAETPVAANPSSDQSTPAAAENPRGEWVPDNWNGGGEDDVYDPVANFKAAIEPRVPEVGGEARVLDPETVIPGISDGPLTSNAGARVSNGEDWDSDSEDDLKIVLNDTTVNQVGNLGEEEDDEDGEDDLVIVTDEGQQYHPHHVMEEPQQQHPPPPPHHVMEEQEGERSEGVEATAKDNGVAGFGNQGFLPQHNLMFKVSSFLLWTCNF